MKRGESLGINTSLALNVEDMRGGKSISQLMLKCLIFAPCHMYRIGCVHFYQRVT